jgi:outer membrane protein W
MAFVKKSIKRGFCFQIDIALCLIIYYHKSQRFYNDFKKAVLVFTFFFCFSSIFAFAAALETFRNAAEKKDGGSRIGLGLLAGYGLFSDSQYNGGFAFGATFTLGFSKNIAIELAGIYLKGDVAGAPEALSKGKLTTTPLQLSLMVRLPINKKLTPYVLAGGSYFLNDFTLDSTILSGWEAVGFTLMEQVDKTFGFHFGGGMEFAMGKTLSAGIDARYCLAKAKGSWSLKDNKTASEISGAFNDLKMDSLMFALGLKYFFK